MEKIKKIFVIGTVLSSVGLAGVISGGSMLGVSTNRNYDFNIKTAIRNINKTEYIYLSLASPSQAYIKDIGEIGIDIFGLGLDALVGNQLKWTINNQVSTPLQNGFSITYASFDLKNPNFKIGENIIKLQFKNICASLKLNLYSKDKLVPCLSEYEMNVEQNSSSNMVEVYWEIDGNQNVAMNGSNLNIFKYMWQTSTNGVNWTDMTQQTTSTLNFDTANIGISYYRCKTNIDSVTNPKYTQPLKVNVVKKTSTLENTSIHISQLNNIQNIFFTNEEITLRANTTPASTNTNNWKYEWQIIHYDAKTNKFIINKFNTPEVKFIPNASCDYTINLKITDGLKVCTSFTSFWAYTKFTSQTKYNASFNAANLINLFNNNYLIKLPNLNNSQLININFLPSIYSSISTSITVYKWKNNQWMDISGVPSDINPNSFNIPNTEIDKGLNKFKVDVVFNETSSGITNKQSYNFNFNAINSLNELLAINMSLGIGANNWGNLSCNNQKISYSNELLKLLKINSYDDFVNAKKTIKPILLSTDIIKPSFIDNMFNTISSNKSLLIAGAVITGLLGSLTLAGVILLILWFIDRRKA